VGSKQCVGLILSEGSIPTCSLKVKQGCPLWCQVLSVIVAKKQTFSIKWMNMLLFSHIYTLSTNLFQQIWY
jgi:hypothetical protein